MERPVLIPLLQAVQRPLIEPSNFVSDCLITTESPVIATLPNPTGEPHP